jgi:hypothetical protein
MIINNIEINKYELLHLINSGKIINAIKLVKTKTRLGLKECKDIVDNLIDDPNFYDENDYKPVTEVLKAYNKPIMKRPKKGSHIIENKSNTKNYIIVFLLLCIVVLFYLYSTK